MIKTHYGIYDYVQSNDKIKPLENCIEETLEQFFTRIYEAAKNDSHSIPYILQYNPALKSWDTIWNSNQLTELIPELSVKQIQNNMFSAYLFKEGFVVCIYKGLDCGGCDVEYKLMKYNTLDDFHKEVSFQ